MAADPNLDLMYRYFGTYLLQSAFVFLVLARKLHHPSDSLILDNCAINLRLLDRFAQITNIDYQRVFAQALRRTIERCLAVSADTTAEEEGWPESEQELDDEILQYRWTAGQRGLWIKNM